jgi:hypothetical protein
LHDPGAFFNQNRSDLYGRCHRLTKSLVEPVKNARSQPL